MRADTAEWVKKAGADFISMMREMNAVNELNYDLICFLAQQSAEKYLKALLCENGVPFPKTHDLNELSALLPKRFEFPESFSPTISRLAGTQSNFAILVPRQRRSWRRRQSRALALFEIGVAKC